MARYIDADKLEEALRVDYDREGEKADTYAANGDAVCSSFKDKDRYADRNEVIREFAERLKANMSNIARMEYGGNIYFCVGYDLIDNLVKEMTEEAEL